VKEKESIVWFDGLRFHELYLKEEAKHKAKKQYLKRTTDRGPSIKARKKANTNKRKIELETWREKNLSPKLNPVFTEHLDKRVLRSVYT
jgi:hypothetical protein